MSPGPLVSAEALFSTICSSQVESTYLQRVEQIQAITVSHFIVAEAYRGELEPEIPCRVRSCIPVPDLWLGALALCR